MWKRIHTQLYAETLAGRTRETFGYVMPTAFSAQGQQGTHHTTKQAGAWRWWALRMGKSALSWGAWGQETRQRQGSEATRAQDCIPARRPPWPHASAAPRQHPRHSHDVSHVKVIPSPNLISSERSNPTQAGWILCGFLQSRLLETPTSLFVPHIICMVLVLLSRQTC